MNEEETIRIHKLVSGNVFRHLKSYSRQTLERGRRRFDGKGATRRALEEGIVKDGDVLMTTYVDTFFQFRLWRVRKENVAAVTEILPVPDECIVPVPETDD